MKQIILETTEDIPCTKCGGIATQGAIYDFSQLYYCNACDEELKQWGTPETIFRIRKI